MTCGAPNWEWPPDSSMGFLTCSGWAPLSLWIGAWSAVVFLAYVPIAMEWWRGMRYLPRTEAARCLGWMAAVFLLCGSTYALKVLACFGPEAATVAYWSMAFTRPLLAVAALHASYRLTRYGAVSLVEDLAIAAELRQAEREEQLAAIAARKERRP